MRTLICLYRICRDQRGRDDGQMTAGGTMAGWNRAAGMVCRRASKGSIMDAVEPRIRALLAEFPAMPSTVVMERIGWARG
jgi:hypothetical protein